MPKIPTWAWVAGLIAAWIYWQQKQPSALIQGPLVGTTTTNKGSLAAGSGVDKPYGTGNSPRGSPMMPLEDSPGYWGANPPMHVPVPAPITYADGTGMYQLPGTPIKPRGGFGMGKMTLQ